MSKSGKSALFWAVLIVTAVTVYRLLYRLGQLAN